MPKVGPARQNVIVRMTDAGIAEIDRIALIDQVLKPSGGPNRSEMIRRLLNEAIAQRRKGHPAKYLPKE